MKNVSVFATVAVVNVIRKRNAQEQTGNQAASNVRAVNAWEK